MLIYLDIDGVMVPANSWRKTELLEDGFPAFSIRAVNALGRILSVSGATIVLTTSHKSSYTLKEWENIFKRRNISVAKIKKLPKNSQLLNRKDELLRHFATKKIPFHFIIIDDDKSLNGLPPLLKDKLIQTSGSVGLTDELADKAIEIIEKSNYEIAP
ncbi:MAG: HAD domain-containing protein [Flavobacteriaceae bacterium]